MKNLSKFMLIILTVCCYTVFMSCNGSGSDGHDHDHEDGHEHHDHEHEGDEEAREHDHSHGDAAHWSYQGETGPEHWAHLIPDCSCDGKSQSPIDFSGEMLGKDFVELQLDYQSDSTLDIINNGHTIQLNYPHGKLMIGDKEFKLVQFHFHAASEHTLNGKQFPLEAHLVHLSADEQIAVVGIWFEEGAENELLKKIYNKLPEEANESVNESMTIDVKNILPATKTYYHYSGSLTTPPCTEGVNWYVMQTPNTASKEQIAQIAKFMPTNNYRPVQALNERKVEDYK